jgi:cell division protein FtsB
MKKSKKNRKIRSLILICVLSALLLTVGTYAWFIGMQTVKVNSFEVEIAAVDGLMLSMDGVNWDTNLKADEQTAYANNANEFLKDEGEGLKPISTIGEFDETSSRLKLYEKGSLTSTKGGYRLMASRVNNYTNKVAGGTEYLEDDGYVAFDLFVMNLSGDAYYPTNNELNEEAIYLTYDSAVTLGQSESKDYGIQNSVRVGFAQIARVNAAEYGNLDPDTDTDKIATVTGMTCAGSKDADQNVVATGICRKAQIWEPNENTHVDGAKTWYQTTCKARRAAEGEEPENGFYYKATENACADLTNYITTNAVAGEIVHTDYVDVYDGPYNGYTATAETLLKQVDTFTDTEKMVTGANRNQFMSLAPNSITKIRVYVWIEGQDIDNYDFASLGNAIKVNFGFTKERITTGEIDPSITPDEDLDAEQLS